MRIILLIISLSVAGLLQAQSLHNNSVISITTGSVLFVHDSLVNNGTIVNNGDMQVGGSWINNNQYDAGQGQITFNSNQPQVINHNDQSFSKLTISGDGEKIFQANITIENELNLSEGILVSENNARIIINSNATVTGGSDEAHIIGSVYHQGAGSKTFPVGNGAQYLPVTLTHIDGAAAEVGVTAHELDGVQLKHARSLEAISTNRYWQIDVVSGSLANTKAVLPVRDEDIVNNPEKVVVAQAASLDASFETLGRDSSPAPLTDGFVTSNNVVTQRFLAIGTAQDDGSIYVYNAVSPNDDDRNEFMYIGNIESFPDNKVRIFNRWGDKVFEIRGYNNTDRVFRGIMNVGGDENLAAGTYYYEVDRNNGTPLVTGYLSLKK